MNKNLNINNDEILDIISRLYCTSSFDDLEASAKALHEDIEIKCFYEGTSTLLVGDKTVVANAGDVIVINPFEFHATVDNGEKAGKYHLLMIPLDFFAAMGIEELDFRNLLLANNKFFKTKFQNDKQLFKILMRITDELINQQKVYRTVIKGLLIEFFAILLRRGMRDSDLLVLKKEILHSYNLIEPSIRYIRDNYTKKISIEQLADLCKVSKHYYCRIFKSITGKTAMEYIRDYRLKMADIMLTNSDNSIMLISEQCGFESANYFCRCYKKVYGNSPSKQKSIKKLK